LKKIVIIGDLIKSRKAESRDKIQQKLQTSLTAINKINQNIISPFTITLGDEFQVLLKNADGLFSNIWQIAKDIYPAKIRFSIGIGEVNTDINPAAAIGMDGPAFYAARKGIDQLKKNNLVIGINGIKNDNDLVESNLSFISHISDSWKKTKYEIIVHLMKKMSAKSISETLRISEQAVYKSINAGALKKVVNACAILESRINQELND
jgi:hypothetical protein